VFYKEGERHLCSKEAQEIKKGGTCSAVTGAVKGYMDMQEQSILMMMVKNIAAGIV